MPNFPNVFIKAEMSISNAKKLLKCKDLPFHLNKRCGKQNKKLRIQSQLSRKSIDLTIIAIDFSHTLGNT